VGRPEFKSEFGSPAFVTEWFVGFIYCLWTNVRRDSHFGARTIPVVSSLIHNLLTTVSFSVTYADILTALLTFWSRNYFF